MFTGWRSLACHSATKLADLRLFLFINRSKLQQNERPLLTWSPQIIQCASWNAMCEVVMVTDVRSQWWSLKTQVLRVNGWWFYFRRFTTIFKLQNNFFRWLMRWCNTILVLEYVSHYSTFRFTDALQMILLFSVFCNMLIDCQKRETGWNWNCFVAKMLING